MSRQLRSRIRSHQINPTSPTDDSQPLPIADTPSPSPAFLSIRLKASKRMKKLFSSHREQRQSLLSPRESLSEVRKSVSSSMLEPSDGIRKSIPITDDTPFKNSAVDITLQPVPTRHPSHAGVGTIQNEGSRQLGAVQTRAPGQLSTPFVMRGTAPSPLVGGTSTPPQPVGGVGLVTLEHPERSSSHAHRSTPNIAQAIPLVEIETSAQATTHSLLKPPSLHDVNISGRDSGYGSNGSGSNNTSPRSEEPPIATSPSAPSPSSPSLELPCAPNALTCSPEQSTSPLLPEEDNDVSLNNSTSKKPQMPPLTPLSIQVSPTASPRMPSSPASGIRPSPAGKTHLRLRLDSLSHPLPALPVPSTPKSPGIPATPYPPGAFKIPSSLHAKAVSEPTPASSTSPIRNDSVIVVGPPSPSTVRSSGSGRPALSLLRLSSRRTPAVNVVDDQPPTSPSATRLPREARTSVPALRRDGSFFYTVAPSEDSHVGSGEEGQDPSESESEEDGDEEEHPSDDDDGQHPPPKQMMTPLLRSLSTGLKAMVGISPSSQTSTPVPAQSPSLTPTPTTRSTLVASGTPSVTLTTMAEDHTGETEETIAHFRTATITQSSSVATPRVRPRPQQISLVQQQLDSGGDPDSRRETIYHTPMHTPTVNETEAYRDSVYFDAEDRGEDEEDLDQLVNVDRPSTFTTGYLDLGESTANLATPRANQTDLLASTAVTPAETTNMKTPLPGNDVSGSSTPRQTGGKGDFSALGLDLSSNAAWRMSDSGQRIARKEASAPQQWDYFSLRGAPPPPLVPSDTPSDALAPTSSPNNTLSVKVTPRTPFTSLVRTPKTPGGRPIIYSQVSHSMIDFGSFRVVDEPQSPQPAVTATSASPKGKERANENPECDDPSTQIIELNSSTSPAHSGIKSPPPPFMSTLTRRMSLPNLSDLSASMPPPPYPKTGIPREEEGKEVLPTYKCGIHFEASMPRKMEFTSPGVLAKDRAWKRVYVVLSGTGLWIYRQDPRRWGIKGHVHNHGHADGGGPGGKRGDGVVDVDDLLVDAPHVHLPLEVLQGHAASRGGPLRRSNSRGSSSGSGGSSLNVNGAPVSRTSVDRSRISTSRRSGEGTLGSTMSMATLVASGAVGIPPSRSQASSSTASINRPPSSFPSRSSNPASSSTSTLTTATNTEEESPVSEKTPFPPDSTPPKPKKSSNSSATSTKHLPFHSQSGSNLLASFQQNTLLRNYSMQNAETGIASDYHKKKNVIRVRAQGEQFLLQADSIMMAVSWIETFQAATNVALDIDVRPMPKLPAFPRRRRRRRPQNPTTADGAGSTPAEPAGDTGTPPEPDNTDNPPPSADSRHSRFSFGRRQD